MPISQNPIRGGNVTSSDGTRIAYQVHGDAPEVFVLAPGLGFPPKAYRYIMEALAGRFRFVTWHARGTHDSGMAPAGHYGVGHHVADLEAIVEAEGLDTFVLGGWSLAVQVSLEYARRHRERCRALILINGPYGELLRLRNALLRHAGRALVALARRHGRLIEPEIRLAFRRPELVARLLQKVGLVAKVNDLSFFLEVAEAFVRQPLAVLAESVAGADAHTAETYLGILRMPTLVTVGTHDWLTPPTLGKRLARALHDAELVQVPGGTHYTMLEYPDVIAKTVKRFLDEKLQVLG